MGCMRLWFRWSRPVVSTTMIRGLLPLLSLWRGSSELFIPWPSRESWLERLRWQARNRWPRRRARDLHDFVVAVAVNLDNLMRLTRDARSVRSHGHRAGQMEVRGSGRHA
ncbi:hypothetical protein B0J12DRAFT_658383 [Macrophomina phaseolina]|uniref:Secreted protein n=1 Tax=Macrophomina phaseolina TaxID=35725 RepID=A0ABQ8GG97_9PEZI|nr:hypothetical protein B0J12DRAFT_658383 [Macrophomina phaseolina]